MAVADTSIKTYRDLIGEGVINSQQERVFEVIARSSMRGKPITARRVAEELGLEPGSVSARINELKNPEVNLVEASEARVICHKSGRRVKANILTERAVELLLNNDQDMTSDAKADNIIEMEQGVSSSLRMNV